MARSTRPPTASTRSEPQAVTSWSTRNGPVETPLRRRNHNQYGHFDPEGARSRNLRYAQEARNFLGPMPVEDFLDEFLPETSVPMPNIKDAFKHVPKGAAKEKDIYIPLISILNGGGRGRRSRCPGFVFVDTSDRTEDEETNGRSRPDVCCYLKPTAKLVKENNVTPCTPLGLAELYIEVKPTPEQDFFSDPSPGDDRASHQFILNFSDEDELEKATEDFGQSVAHAAEILARQHRLFLFSISLSGSCARLIRWDRAGAIATEAFDLHDRPELLCEFLWRFSHSSDADRGYDTTVEQVGPEEERNFKEVITSHVKEQLGLEGTVLSRAVREHYWKGMVVAINVYDGQSKDAQVHRYLVSRPVASPLSVASRATRGYWAVDANLKVAFLKDTWRYAVRGMELEGTILDELRQAGVENVPNLIHHGDVPEQEICDDESTEHDVSDGTTMRGESYSQCTRTDDYVASKWLCTGDSENEQRKIVVTPHVHYRLTLSTVGYALQTFRGSEELLHCTYGAFHAMLEARNKNNRLHRDISLGNIIMVKEPSSHIRKGYLIDWELSCYIDRDEEARQYERTGTWQFMSAKVLSGDKALHTLQDDMESILYVVLYCALRWGPHNVKRKTLFNTLRHLFDEAWEDDDGTSGGSGKLLNKFTRRYTKAFTFHSVPLQYWLDTVMNLNSPLPGREYEEFRDKWEDPVHLDTFWTHFLQTSSLDKTDRKEHDTDNAPRDSAVKPYDSPLPSGSVLISSKRKKQASPTEADARQLKRSRTGQHPGEAAQSKSIAPRGTFVEPSPAGPSTKRLSSGSRAGHRSGKHTSRSVQQRGSRAGLRSEPSTLVRQNESGGRRRTRSREGPSSSQGERTTRTKYSLRPDPRK
ncbi:hypothetical protein AcW1_008660 [Taiwanofungus camphoratus]|nr:hypothetical protein AcW1_008660 [Antrodia cinnamomea]